jgi:hypothetical protein
MKMEAKSRLSSHLKPSDGLSGLNNDLYLFTGKCCKKEKINKD